VRFSASLKTIFLVDCEHAITTCGVADVYSRRQFAFVFNVAVVVLTPLQ